MQVLPNSNLPRGFMFLSVLLLASALVPAAQLRGPQPEVVCPSCDDLNPCTIDSCDTTTDTCRHDPRSCDDGNQCTTDSCVIGSPTSFLCGHDNLANGTSCNDGNSCTTGDACLQSGFTPSQCTGQLQPAGTGCNDGDSCTASDTCDESGQCAGTPIFPGSPCDDQSLCTSSDTCVASGGSLICQGTPQSCGDSNLCTQDVCDPATGQCSNPPVNCDDGNSCTDDSCSPASGVCVRANVSGSCSFIDRCFAGTCSAGNCLGTAVNCNDGISCTIDSCVWNTGCAHAPNPSLCGQNGPCAQWVCTTQSGCFNFIQQGPAECDGNICTTDECRQNSCVTLSANTNPCSDSNPCTNNERCAVTSEGPRCVGTAFCDDGNACTADTCNPSTLACSHTNLMGSCNDGNPCNGVDTCVNGTCQSGTATCDDGLSCTTDACTQFGCTHTAEGCDDGNPCTFDTCDASSACVHINNNDSCNDGNPCTSTDRCIGGACTGTPLNCDDGNICTTESCNPATGACQIGPPLNCDDGDACTVDSCTPTGCEHMPPGPPTITVELGTSLGTNVLTPANHKMIDVSVGNTARDGCGTLLDTILTAASSSEPDDAPGPSDGHTLNDIQGAEIGTTDYLFQVRAERDSSGSGRIYTVQYTATDSAGQTASATATIMVPLKKHSPLPTNPTDPKRKKEQK